MSYIFGDDGTFSGYYNDGDIRVFILEGLNQCLSEDIVQAAIRGRTPSEIGGFQVLRYMGEPVLRDIAATVYSESGHNRDESEGIARVIRNRAEHRALTYELGFLARIGGNAMYGRRSSRYATANNQTIEHWTGNMLSDLESTARGLVNRTDITNGAYFWEGTSLLQRPSHQWRRYLDGHPPIWITTAVLGQTTFCAYNPDGPRKYRNNVWP
jgi:hypothetical protein